MRKKFSCLPDFIATLLKKILTEEEWNHFTNQLFTNEKIKFTFFENTISSINDLSALHNLFVQETLPSKQWKSFTSMNEKDNNSGHPIITRIAALAYFSKLANNADDLSKLLGFFPITKNQEFFRLCAMLDNNDVLNYANNDFLRNFVINIYDLQSIWMYLPNVKRINFFESLGNKFLCSLVKDIRDLRILSMYLPGKRMFNFTGCESLAFLYDENHRYKSVPETIQAGIKSIYFRGNEEMTLRLAPETLEQKRNILFCILRAYQSELISREKEYNPTILGISLPIDVEWGIPKTDKLLAVKDLFDVLSKNKSLEQVYQAHENALSQGTLGDIYLALKFLEDHELSLGKEPKKFDLKFK